MAANRRFPRPKPARDRPLRQVAEDLTEQLLRHHARCGGGDVREPDTWVRVARDLGCRVVDFFRPGGPAGDYTPSGAQDGVGVITYNTALPAEEQAATLIHETSHHALYPHEQGILFATLETERYDTRRYPGDIESQSQRRHLAARLVERSILGRRGKT